MTFSRFITRRYLNDASFTVSGISGDLGPANLLDHDRTQVWRAPSSQEAYADFDLSEPKPWNAIAIVSHSLGYEGSFEVWASQHQAAVAGNYKGGQIDNAQAAGRKIEFALLLGGETIPTMLII